MEGDLDGVKHMGYSQMDCKHILIIISFDKNKGSC
jgi:hypothetical protein